MLQIEFGFSRRGTIFSPAGLCRSPFSPRSCREGTQEVSPGQSLLGAQKGKSSPEKRTEKVPWPFRSVRTYPTRRPEHCDSGLAICAEGTVKSHGFYHAAR